MFLHLSVILFTGGCLPQCMLGYTPQEQTPPWEADIPTPEADTPPPPHREADKPPRAVHAGKYGQQAGGTHPTGMHTCYYGIC